MGADCLDGLPLWRRVRAGLGYLSQEPSVIRAMTVADNIGLVGSGVDVAAALEAAGLTGLADAPANTLSGGERRRLVRACVVRSSCARRLRVRVCLRVS